MQTLPNKQMLAIVVLAVAMVPAGALSATYPLEVTNIRPAGDGPNAANRIYRAYPGLEYNIRAAVIGGDYPYTFALSGAPKGMTIDAKTGVIVWLDPQADAAPTLTVRDAAGTSVSATWRIAVTTAGFQFVDAVNGQPPASGGKGTAAKPWRTLADMRASGAPGAITYFRAGTYTPAGMPTEGTPGPDMPETRVLFYEALHSVIWLAYPGDERPVIDYGHAGGHTTPRFRMRGHNVYVDGFETRRSHIMAFQVFNEGRGQTGPTFRRMRMHTHGPGLDGSNAAFIMTTFGERPAENMVIQDSEFFNIVGTGACALKLYSQRKMLIEDNVFYETGPELEAALALKQDLRQFTVRGNRFDVPVKAIGGNMSSGGRRVKGGMYGEILYNNVRGQQYALDLNQDSAAGRVDVHHNTLVGRVQVRNADAADGPFAFSFNVVVSPDEGTRRHPRLYLQDVSAPERIEWEENLTGSPRDKVVDSTGALTAKYAKYGASHGHAATQPQTRGGGDKWQD